MNFVQQSNILSKNRRSHSMLSSQQNSKRTSLSTSNLNLYPITGIDLSPIISHNRNSNNQRQKSQHTQHIQYQNNNPQSINKPVTKPHEQQLLQKVRKNLIQPYKIIRKHIKQSSLTFLQTQLKQMYQNMSTSLKSLQKYISNVGNSMMMNSFLSVGNNQYSSNGSGLEKMNQKIKMLEGQIEDAKERHSQEVRQMIQTHEQEMMFFQQEQGKKFKQIKKEYQNQIQQILKTHKKRQQQIKSDLGRKVNQQVKLKIDLFRKQQSIKYDSMKREYEDKEIKYKQVVKQLIKKLKQIKCQYETSQKQNHNKITLLRQFIKKISKSFQSYKQNINAQNNNDQFLKTLLQRLNIIGNNNSPLVLNQTKSNPSQMKPKQQPTPKQKSLPQNQCLQSYTQAIDQMFYKSHEQILGGEKNLFEENLQVLLEKLILYGFFCEQNEDNIGKLINLGRGENSIWDMSSAILSHSIYPLIIEKIKITLSKLSQYQQTYNNQSQKQLTSQIQTRPPLDPYYQKNTTSGSVKQFNSSNKQPIIKPYYPTIGSIKYRNIQSIEQLEVSDSFMNDGRDDDGGVFQYDRFQKQKEIEIGEDNGFQHSPIKNYEGYGTPEKDIQEEDGEDGGGSEHSSSFDVDNLQ